MGIEAHRGLQSEAFFFFLKQMVAANGSAFFFFFFFVFLGPHLQHIEVPRLGIK